MRKRCLVTANTLSQYYNTSTSPWTPLCTVYSVSVHRGSSAQITSLQKLENGDSLGYIINLCLLRLNCDIQNNGDNHCFCICTVKNDFIKLQKALILGEESVWTNGALYTRPSLAQWTFFFFYCFLFCFVLFFGSWKTNLSALPPPLNCKVLGGHCHIFAFWFKTSHVFVFQVIHFNEVRLIQA